jgi:single-strand DNA-binding protein
MFQTTITANVTRDPELRYTDSGKAVVNLPLAHNSRTKVDGQWVDSETTYLEAELWEDMAEHVAETLRRGDRVLVAGDITVKAYPGTDGQKRTKVVIKAEEIGPSLRFATAQIHKTTRGTTAANGTGSTADADATDYHRAVQITRDQLGALPAGPVLPGY